MKPNVYKHRKNSLKMGTIIFLCLLGVTAQAQSGFEKILKSGEILVNGLSILREGKPAKAATGFIESVCVKNKLAEKITFNIHGTDEDGNAIAKNLVIQKDGKECLLELQKGIYTYEIVLPNHVIFKKGEYKFDESMIITVKDQQ